MRGSRREALARPPTPLPQGERGSRRWMGLRAPNLVGVLLDRAVAGEFARAGDVENALLRPFVRFAIEVAKGAVRLEVGRQIRQMHIGVAMGQKRAAQRLENTWLSAAEMIGKDQVERFPRL